MKQTGRGKQQRWSVFSVAWYQKDSPNLTFTFGKPIVKEEKAVSNDSIYKMKEMHYVQF